MARQKKDTISTIGARTQIRETHPISVTHNINGQNRVTQTLSQCHLACVVHKPLQAACSHEGASLNHLAEATAGAEQWHMPSMQRKLKQNLIVACFELRRE